MAIPVESSKGRRQIYVYATTEPIPIEKKQKKTEGKCPDLDFKDDIRFVLFLSRRDIPYQTARRIQGMKVE